MNITVIVFLQSGKNINIYWNIRVFERLHTELNFALWEPSATGQALGILAMFPAIYQYDIGIYPDFEADKTYVKGTFLVKGHIRLVHVLISGIRLLKERDIRNFIKKFFK